MRGTAAICALLYVIFRQFLPPGRPKAKKRPRGGQQAPKARSVGAYFSGLTRGRKPRIQAATYGSAMRMAASVAVSRASMRLASRALMWS